MIVTPLFSLFLFSLIFVLHITIEFGIGEAKKALKVWSKGYLYRTLEVYGTTSFLVGSSIHNVCCCCRRLD